MFAGAKRAAAGIAMLIGMMIASIAPATAQYWQCAPYARSISGIEIYGNAHTWWAQADGKYERGEAPEVGAVLAMKSSGKMRLGHVAMVSKIVSEREVLLTHANWSRGGRVERDVRAIDVSEAGDWSKVKVWYGPMGDLGMTEYPAYGFIYAKTKNAPAIQMADSRLARMPVVMTAFRAESGD
ncbi:CHAP domain-containing protein [Sphingomonas cavernae]|uniref:CHAP domain-containing protein n=1 Tax=Sphingomonas cavernae TaxID=2320861 RepID=A0A418W7B5_9SPHN|nr:CHAP domain-containing protein [Sphingomonas cavernae]